MNRAKKDLRSRVVKTSIWVIISGFALSIIASVSFLFMGISLFLVSGPSMSPTLENGDVLILKKISTVTQGQIYIFKKPTDWGYMGEERPNLIKRIQAIPGDKLEYDGSDFKVNGESFFNVKENNYECSKGDKEYSHILTDKEVFVTGDNANHSLDSRRIFCDGETDKIFIDKKDMVDTGNILRIF